MRKLNLVQKFALLSGACIAGLCLALAPAISYLLEQHMLQLEWVSTAEVAKYLVEERNLVPYFTDPQLRREPARYREAFQSLLGLPEVVRIKIWDREATVLWSDDARIIGKRFPDNPHVMQALGGQISVALKILQKAEHQFERERFTRLAEIYTPIVSRTTGETVGVVEVYKLPTRLFATVQTMRLVVWGLVLSGGIILYATLFPIVKRSYRIQVELQESLLQNSHCLEERTRELEAANARLQEVARQAEEASRSKSEFLANMSHELRTPLNAILGFSQVLESRFHGELNSKQTRFVHNIHTSGTHLLTLINDILDLSKVEAGKMELQCEPFAVGAALGEIEAAIEPLASQKSIGLTTAVEGGLDLLTADPARFKQVLYNLLTNAVKFTPEGGEVRVTVRRVGSPPAGYPPMPLPPAGPEPAPYLEVAVSDSGIGIAPKDQERIFADFQQVDSSLARLHQGTGLGLSLTRKLVQLHGGRIRVESELGKGSTFRFVVPEMGPRRVSAPAEPAPEGKGGPGREERARFGVGVDA